MLLLPAMIDSLAPEKTIWITDLYHLGELKLFLSCIMYKTT